MNTGEAIGILAKQKGFNLRQLAAKAGIPYNTLYAIVKRKSSRIEIGTLRSIANALDVSIDELEPFTPNVMHMRRDDTWVVGPRFETVVSSRMIDAETPEERKAAREDVQQVLRLFDLLNEEGQKKAIEMVAVLTEAPPYLNPDAMRERKPTAEVADQIFTDYGDVREAEEEAIYYETIDLLLKAHDNADEERITVLVEMLIVQHSGGKSIKEIDCETLTDHIWAIVAAHDEGREEDEHRLIAEFIDTAE